MGVMKADNRTARHAHRLAALRTWIGRALLAACAGLLVLAAWVGWTLTARYRSAIYRTPADVPRRAVAVVFGAGYWPDGTLSNILQDRVDGAVELYRAGRVRKVLFSGDAYALVRSYDPKSYFEPASVQALSKMFRILHENADVFTSSNVEPLMTTGIPGVLVNRFRGEKKTIWTVFNANYRTAKGRLVEVPAETNARYADLWNGAPVRVRTVGKSAFLEVEIAPRDVACIEKVDR